MSGDAADGVTGRINPGPVRHPLSGGHDVQWTQQPDGQWHVWCTPCTWAVTVEGHHDDDALRRLAAMHRGETTP